MRAKKKFGQHFLQPGWADRLLAAIEPREHDRFLEIGPGPGALTVRLAPRVAHLTAVELDPEMIGALRPKLPANVTLIEEDFLQFDLRRLAGAPLRVAGNLPYNVASPIVFKLLHAHTELPPDQPPLKLPRSAEALAKAEGGSSIVGRDVFLHDATVMVQREVADRLEARPGTKDYGVLTILVGLHADVRRLLTLPPGAFRPAPKVHTAVVRLRFRPPAVALSNEADFERMVRSMFTQRRKTLANALRAFGAARGVDPAGALARAGIDSRRRPETLQLTELARLAECFA
jgi:16S rRNA (adenine1518-N6/adenine1519-N6)-dimethyltransferase